MNERIRRARFSVKLSQSRLAEYVGVRRSAVAQWESRDGPKPTMEHLSSVAVITGVPLEWLGTGRGPTSMSGEATPAAILSADFAQDDFETECLLAVRRIPAGQRKDALSILQILGKR